MAKETITIEFKSILKTANPEDKSKALMVMNEYGFSDNTFSNWKKNAPEQVKFLAELSEALNVPINDFIKKV